MNTSWQPNDWRQLPPVQMPQYANADALHDTRAQLAQSAPLVFAGEVDHLTKALGDVANGRGFLLQGGDCAESFAHYHPDNLQRMFKVFLQMAMVLTYGAGCPVVKVGRIAGQFAKPRSSDVETRDGETLPSYRGDIINDVSFNAEAREPDPYRMLRAYSQSAASLNFLRGLAQGGFSSLKAVSRWNADFLDGSDLAPRYRAMNHQIDEALKFMQACQVDLESGGLSGVDLYASHEALLLEYEQPLTRQDSESGRWYGTSGHMLWIGDRTRDPEGAHVNFLKGVSNPLGLKVGPTTQADDLRRLLDVLNPENTPGRLTLISRMGAEKVEQYLPSLVQVVKEHGASVVWSCDPMHGNTHTAEGGLKTRHFDNIMAELKGFFAVHRSEGTHPGGVHIEMTARDVTECTGGSQCLQDADLSRQYETQCDPRLNASQSLELAFAIAELLKGEREGE